MIWKICFAGAILFVLAGTAVYMICRKCGENRIQYLGVGVFLASVTMCFPVMYMQENTGIALAMCISHSIRMFVVDTGADDILSMLTQDVLGSMLLPYKILAVILYLLAPVFTLGVVLQYFSNTFERLRLRLKKKYDLYIFSELNARSLEIASDMWNCAKKSGHQLEIVFCCSDKKDSVNTDQEKSARRLNAVLLPEEIIHVRLNSCQRTVDYYMISEDDDTNVDQTLKMIDDMTGGSVWYTQRRLCQRNVTIHCYASNAEAEILIDAKEKEDLKVILVDEVRDAVYEQLYEYPLYTNKEMLVGQKNDTITLLIAGCGKAGSEFLKAAVWCGQMLSAKLMIHVIDLEGDKIQDRLEAECPELLSRERGYRIFIHKGDILGSRSLSDIEGIGQADYCVAALGDDELTIRAAVRMRRHFCTGTGRKDPFICAYVQSTVKKMAVWELSETTRNKMKRSYDIVPFGCGGAYYGNKSDTAFILEYLGLGVQSHYFRLNRESDAESRRYAVQNFYEKQVNRRSSIASGLHICTKLWEMGYGILHVPKNGKMLECYHKCINPVNFSEVWSTLKENEHKAFYNLEHERWMAYIRTEGWKLASNSGTDLASIRACYEAYCSDFKNQNYLTKMHPALVPIKNDDPSIATLQQVDKMIVQVNREKGLGAYYPDYVQSDAELVDHIGEIVSGAWCGPEGIQIAGTLAKEGICVICTLEDIRRYKEEQL